MFDEHSYCFNLEHYLPGSYFCIRREGENSDGFFAQPASHDVPEPCNEAHDTYYLGDAEMRHVGKPTAPVMPPPMRPSKCTNPNIYVASANANSMPPLNEENGHEISEDADYRNDANALEEKGSYSVSTNATRDGIVFTSANKGFQDDERVVMTPPKDLNENTAIPASNDDELSVPRSSYSSLLTSSSEGDRRGPNFSFNVPVGTVSMQGSNVGPKSEVLMESSVAEQEVFEQEVPPTPIEPKQMQYSMMNGNQERRIDDCLQESVNVEPVEEKSKSVPSDRNVTEAVIDVPLKSQQKSLGKKEEALVIPTLKSSHESPLEVNIKQRWYGETQQK